MLNDFFSYGFVGKYLIQFTTVTPIVVVLMIGSVLVVAVASYFLGSMNFAIIISGKKYHQDIRKHGSNNAGMTNMMRTYGKKAAGLTLLGDSLKAVVSCLIGYALLGQFGAYLSGVFCILGHMFPIYYRFKGGKGVVTAAITILMCNPLVFAILFLLFVIIVLSTKYISLGSVMCMLLYPVVLDRIERSVLFHENPPEGAPLYILFAFLMTFLVVFKHWENIKRLWNGTENKFSFKKSVKTSEVIKTPSQETEVDFTAEDLNQSKKKANGTKKK